jgi:PAS domain S-box-containing protein
MARTESSPKKEAHLRKRAEKLLSKKGQRISRKLPEDVQKLIQELQVHQVELEMQNEELRQAQLEVEESRNKYAELYDFAPVGYFTFDQKGRILEVNLTGAWLLGVERGSLMNEPFFRFVAPESRNLFHSCQKGIFTRGATETLELKLRKKDGSSFYASLLCIPGQDREGKFTQCRCAITDITEHKQMEEKVAQLASFPELNPNPVIEVDSRGWVYYLNPTAERIFPDLQEMGARHPWLAGLESIVAGFESGEGRSYTREKQIDGIWYAQSFHRPGTEDRYHIYGLDISQRKKMEEEIRRSRDELEIRVQKRTAELARINERLELEIAERRQAEKMLVEQSKILEGFFISAITPLVFLDRDFNFIRVNEAYARACQRDVSDFAGHNHFEFYPSDAKAIFDQVVQTKVPHQTIARPFVFPDHPEWGVTYWNWTLTPLLDDGGEVEFLVFALEDVTAHKRAEAAVMESEKHLRKLSSLLIAAQESERKRIARELHDGLGQSLTAIKFRVESFLQEISKSRIRTSAKPLEAVISMVQESVREIRRVQTDLRPSILDDLGIVATISWFCREYQTTYPGIRMEKQIDVRELEVPESLKMVIYRIIQEALNNISKHSQADLVHFSLRKTNGLLELSIQDNGQGFDLPEVLSVESSGRGLGLVSMRERAEHSGGSLLIESANGKGTLIRASWPM